MCERIEMPRDDIAEFWRQTRQALDEVDPDPTLEEVEEKSGREYVTYRVVMASYGGRRIRAWFSLPKQRASNRPLPAVMTAPGYSGNKPIPVHLAVAGYAVLTLSPRAQGEIKAEWDLEYGTKLTYNLTDRGSYYYRGGYMDCVRGVAFLCSRPEVDATRVAMVGSQPGRRPDAGHVVAGPAAAATVSEQPFLCNYPISSRLTSNPYSELHPDERQGALATLEYFDPLNLADAVECPILVNIGALDDTCPCKTIMPVFERIPSEKAVVVYPNLGHGPCTDFNLQAIDWLRRHLD